MPAEKRLRDTEEAVPSPAPKQSRIQDFFSLSESKSRSKNCMPIYAVETANSFLPLEISSEEDVSTLVEDTTTMEARVGHIDLAPEAAGTSTESSLLIIIAKTVECLFRSIQNMNTQVKQLTAELSKLSANNQQLQRTPQKGLPTETEIHQTSQMNLISWDDLGEPMESTQTPEEHHHAQAGQGTNLTPLDSKRQLTHKFLANPIEDDLFNSFGNLPCNEQQSIIDRLDFIRHKLSEIKDSEIQPADMPKASPANLEEQCQNKIRPADPPELQQDDYEIDSSLLFSVYSNKHLLSVADSKSLAEELADVAKQSKTAQPELNKQTKTKTSPATSTRKRTNGCVVEEQFVEEIEMDPSNLEEATPGHIVPEGSQESGHN
ncbi:UNVERIFIED_CONTAM: hypothetical protein K2H54_058040 [Gekko kuhli]